MPSASLISCAFLGDCVYLMRDSRRTPDGHPVRQSYRLLSHINRDKLDIFRIEKLWKNEKYVLRFYLFSSSCTLPEQCWIVTTILIIKLLPSLFSFKERNGLPLVTIIFVPMKPTTLHPVGFITMNYFECRFMRSFP